MQCYTGVSSTNENRHIKKYEERDDIITAAVMHRHSSLRLLPPEVCIVSQRIIRNTVLPS